MVRRKRRRLKLTTPGLILAISVCVAAIAVGLVLWGLNSGPNFPEISYVPDLRPIDGGDVSREQVPPLSLARDASGLSGSPPLSAGGGMALAQLSREEKISALEQKYSILFGNLKNTYQNELSRLIQCARRDYEAAGRGEKNVSVSTLAVQYYKAAQVLEKECDQRFARLLGDMKGELKMYGLPLDLARQAEQEYQDQKSGARKEILMKVASYAR